MRPERRVSPHSKGKQNSKKRVTRCNKNNNLNRQVGNSSKGASAKGKRLGGRGWGGKKLQGIPIALYCRVVVHQIN